MRSLPDVNRAFAEIDLPIELVRGEGYHYFVYDDGTPTGFDTKSIMVPYFNQMAPSRWHREGLQFFLDTKALMERRNKENTRDEPEHLRQGLRVLRYHQPPPSRGG